MARFSEPKQKRAILKQYGLYIVKTPDMCTYHKTFEEAVEAYGLVYGCAPIAGVIETSASKMKRLDPDAVIQAIKDQRKQMETTYVKMAEGFEKSAKSFEDVLKRSRAALEISRELRQRMKDRQAFVNRLAKQNEEEAA